MKCPLVILLILSNFSGRLSDVHVEIPLSNFPAFEDNTVPGEEKPSPTGDQRLEFEDLSDDDGNLRKLANDLKLNKLFGKCGRSWIHGKKSKHNPNKYKQEPTLDISLPDKINPIKNTIISLTNKEQILNNDFLQLMRETCVLIKSHLLNYMFYRLSIVNANEKCKDGYGPLKAFGNKNGKYMLCCQTTKEKVFHFSLEGFPAYEEFLKQHSNKVVSNEEISVISGKTFNELKELTVNQVGMYENQVIINRRDKALDLLSSQVEDIFKIQDEPSHLKYFAKVNEPYTEVELSVADLNLIVKRFELEGCREHEVKEQNYSYSFFLMEIIKPEAKCSGNYKYLGEFDILGEPIHICCKVKQTRRFNK
jgi:hypothetical protein